MHKQLLTTVLISCTVFSLLPMEKNTNIFLPLDQISKGSNDPRLDGLKKFLKERNIKISYTKKEIQNIVNKTPIPILSIDDNNQKQITYKIIKLD